MMKLPKIVRFFQQCWHLFIFRTQSVSNIRPALWQNDAPIHVIACQIIVVSIFRSCADALHLE